MRCTVYSAESRARKKVAHKISLFIHADTVDFLGREAYNNTNRTRHASRVATAHDADHVGSFFIPGVFLMQPRKQHQPALPIEKQIENLKRLGLSFEDEDSAGDFLRDVSYFRLVKAYSLNLKNANGTYIDGVTFDGLKNLYLFDSKLRHLLIPLLERVYVVRFLISLICVQHRLKKCLPWGTSLRGVGSPVAYIIWPPSLKVKGREGKNEIFFRQTLAACCRIETKKRESPSGPPSFLFCIRSRRQHILALAGVLLPLRARYSPSPVQR